MHTPVLACACHGAFVVVVVVWAVGGSRGWSAVGMTPLPPLPLTDSHVPVYDIHCFYLKQNTEYLCREYSIADCAENTLWLLMQSV